MERWARAHTAHRNNDLSGLVNPRCFVDGRARFAVVSPLTNNLYLRIPNHIFDLRNLRKIERRLAIACAMAGMHHIGKNAAGRMLDCSETQTWGTVKPLPSGGFAVPDVVRLTCG